MKIITQEEFDTFKVRVINKCMKDIKEYGSNKSNFEFHPSIYLKAFNKTYKEIPLPGELFGSDHGKDICVNIIKKMITTAESPVVCFATEGYQAQIDKDNVDINNLPRPSELPEDQRDEVLFMSFEAHNLPPYFISFTKEYDKESNAWSLKPHPRLRDALKEQGTPSLSETGRFSNFYSN